MAVLLTLYHKQRHSTHSPITLKGSGMTQHPGTKCVLSVLIINIHSTNSAILLQGSDTTQPSCTNVYYPHFIINNIHSTNSVILLQGSDTTQISSTNVYYPHFIINNIHSTNSVILLHSFISLFSMYPYICKTMDVETVILIINVFVIKQMSKTKYRYITRIT